MGGPFFERVYALVRQVPAGRVVTYGQVARALGSPGAARTVGWAMRVCPADVPWHRVVNGQGAVSARGRLVGAAVQRALLEEEGVEFDHRGRIDLAENEWDGI
ncbi:MAG: methylated-DNA--[protein]-cysteine S-methyltransferase [Anaerolineales bacterium]